jgi:hemoglobin
VAPAIFNSRQRPSPRKGLALMTVRLRSVYAQDSILPYNLSMAENASTLFRVIGGTAGCRRLSEAFYARVNRDPVLRPLFPGKTMTCAIEEFSAFLVQFLGGPSGDSQRRWWLSLRESHLRFPIGAKERAAWMGLMSQAVEAAGIEEPARGALQSLFERASTHVVNRGRGSAPHESSASLHPEVASRWDSQLELEAVVSAIRRGDSGPASRFVGHCEPTIGVGVLALMLRAHMTAEVRELLKRNPTLAHEKNAGRTLLHSAAAMADLDAVELLLRLGVDPNLPDGGNHTPLYSLANECKVAGAGAVVGALVRAGADVNAAAGVMKCTPLHMAARRGNTEAAEALLEWGANIDARDKRGDSPLCRARKCRKPEMVSLLLSRGATERSA